MFEEKAVKDTRNSWEDARELNEQLTQLKKFKLEEISVEGDFEKSKLAWKVAILSQAYLQRVCELSEACMINWNNGHYISSITLARSVIETGSALRDLEKQTKVFLEKEDLNSLDSYVMSKTFSTKLKDWLAGKKFYAATNILTLIQKMEQELPRLMETYHHLSEFAHPNHLGVWAHYCDLDRSNGTVSYRSPTVRKEKFHSIVCALTLIEFSLMAYKNLQISIVKIAELQHKTNPVKKP